MFLHEPIIYITSGHLNYENERRIACDWFDYCGLKYEMLPYGNSEGFYALDNHKKHKKVYICSTQDLGKRSIGHFWFGFPTNYVRGNSDTGLILIMVWEDESREYLIINNHDVLIWRNIWYERNNYYSIDVNVKAGKYNMKRKDGKESDFRENINNILLLFE